MANKYDDLIEAALGPVYWNHAAGCECDVTAPENEEAYMSRNCLVNYHTGSVEKLQRGRALQELCKIIQKEALSKVWL